MIDKEQAKNRIAEAAVAVERSHGLPAEVAFGQAAFESNWLKSSPGNNCFGFKHYPGAFGRQLLETWECFTPGQMQTFIAAKDGREILDFSKAPRYFVRDWFATFPDLESCFVKRALRWKAGRHLPWVDAFYAAKADFPLADAQWTALFREIAASGYATADPDKYAEGCMARLIEGSEALAAARAEVKKDIA